MGQFLLEVEKLVCNTSIPQSSTDSSLCSYRAPRTIRRMLYASY